MQGQAATPEEAADAVEHAKHHVQIDTSGGRRRAQADAASCSSELVAANEIIAQKDAALAQKDALIAQQAAALAEMEAQRKQ
eukprot:COSAG04_NODE_1214_length_7713_cov_7.578934_3_plen_82_part_00